jgi:DNA-binding NtrC family response regulator
MAHALHTPGANAVTDSSALAREVSQMDRRVLLAEDNEVNREQIRHILETDQKVKVDTCRDGREALDALATHNYSLLLTDLKMPNLDGLALIEEVQKRRLPVTVIVTTGYGGINEAVAAMKRGAYDFLTKPVDPQELRLTVQRALRERTLEDEILYLRQQLQSKFHFQGILSKNPRMHAIFELIGNIAQTNSTVLIEGETGTGKEQVARAIHASSSHRSGPLVAVNCAALPETLLESELFGHEKGAFTSAVGQRRGRFELAHGGTIFLDEVGDIPAAMQAKLLRVLQERRFERVGGAESIEVDVRVIAATNRPLQRLVRKGKFREDLYYRLNVVKIELPPLRDRPEDIPLLATHFAEKYARPGEAPKRVAPQAMEVLLNYRWPGNIRELENAVERACVTSGTDEIGVENLPSELSAPPVARVPVEVDINRPLPELLRDTLAEFEKQYIRKALKKTRGNVGRCARICGLSRRSLTYKIAEYGIDRKTFRDT